MKGTEMSNNAKCEAEWERLVPILNEGFPLELRELLGLVSVLPRVFETDDPENRWWAGVAVDIKFKSAEGAQNPDPKFVALLEKMIGRSVERYPDNENADKDSKHAFYNIMF